MFSWLNFEELLIHNPIELINPSKDTISVAMNKKQYIEFFSNKYTYNGLYYDEEMDFCLFYYADPLQSYKEGDMYAQGYIDVEMKIYRVKWLCNVSISRPSGLLQTQVDTQDGAQGVLQPDGKYKHTAWAYSADGADRFSTIYPRYNLLNQNDFVPGYLSSTGILAPTTERNEQTSPFLEIDASESYTLQVFVTLSEISRSSWSAVSWFDSNQNFIKREAFQESNVPTTGYYVYSHTVQPPSNAKFVRASFRRWDDGKLKLEQGSNATPYLPSESETTGVDGPSYIGQYTDYTLEDSTDPSSYTWRKIQNDVWNVTKTEMVVNTETKTITTVLNGALAKCTKDKNITGWKNLKPNDSYNYRKPCYQLGFGSTDNFIISGYGLRGLKNG